MKRSLFMDDRAINFPEGWHDEIVCGSLRHNKNGSITVNCCINVYSDDGTVYGVDSRTIRLPKKWRLTPPQVPTRERLTGG